VASVVLQGGAVGAKLLVDRALSLIGGQPVRGGQIAQRDPIGGWLTIQ
jgi:hypothetical protein